MTKKYKFIHISSNVVKFAPKAIPAFIGVAILGLSWYAHGTPLASKKTVKPTHQITVTEPTTNPASSQPTPTQPAPTTASPSTKPTSVKPKVVHIVVPSPRSSVSNLKPTSSQAASSSGTTSGGNSSAPSIVDYSSFNWSGYMATSGSYTRVSSDWVVPSATSGAGSLSADATWIGIGGVTTGDLIQVGTDNTVSNGKLTTNAFYEMLPAASQNIQTMSVSPGDTISASVTELSASLWNITIHDDSKGTSFSTNVSYSSTNSSAEWIEEDPSFTNGSLIPLDNFSTASFSGAATTVNGTSTSIANSANGFITLVDQSGLTEATPTAISGTGFSVSRS